MTKFKALKTQLKQLKDSKLGIFRLFYIYTITAGLLPVIGIIFPKYIIDSIQTNKNFESIYLIITIMGILLIVFGCISTFISHLSSSKFIDIRTKQFSNYFDFYLNVNFKNIEDPNWRDVSEKATETLNSDGYGYQATFKILFEIFAIILSTFIYIYLIISFNLWIIFCILIYVVISFYIVKISKDYEIKKDKDLIRQKRKLNYYGSITSDFTYTKDIRIYSLKDKILGIFKNENIVYNHILKNIKNKQYKLALIELFTKLIQDGIIYYLLINSVVSNKISIGEFVMYVGTANALGVTLKSILEMISNLYEYLGHTAKYFDFIACEEYLLNEGKMMPNIFDTMKIEFRNVSFKYPNTDNYILKDFNFIIDKGTKLAIVGANGAGKTTLIKLICGLYEVTDGQILINDIDLKEYNRRALYKEFSIVFQEINIFAFSILENVSLKNELLTDENKVIECLKNVGLLDKVMSLPNKLRTNMLKIIDEKGVEFSGGENQKLAIARALYQDGKCVILDEPTAALDALAEAQIYNDFNYLIKNKTAIYISHRLASTKFCDKIALFNKDGLVEYGNHEELMAKKGLYFEMFTTQGKYYQDGVI